ncbi:MAG: sorbosone dehydrogenase family protein [Vicinamibacterales bacterium]
MLALRVFCASVACAAVAAPVAAQPAAPDLATRVVVEGVSQPVAFVPDPTSPTVAFLVLKGGRILVLREGQLQPDPFIDLSEIVLDSGERGLLGMACASSDARRCFVNFVNREGDTVIARFERRIEAPLELDPISRFDLQWSDGRRVIRQPFANHNGGTLRFGPDGFLYIGLGDGGSGNDPAHRAQDPATLLGKMLRIDVNVPDGDDRGYRVPDDNPFLDGNPVRALPEIWAFGLRNPWKFSFDDPRQGGSGAMLIGDVGQSAREEIDYEPPGAGGRNYGWRNREGSLAGVTSRPAAFEPLVGPIHDYPRSIGQSVTGGTVYRGSALPLGFSGRYFFADFASGRVFSLALVVDADTHEARAEDVRDHTTELWGPNQPGSVAALEPDASGDLHIVDLTGGRILRVESTVLDGDGDGLLDAWERQHGLDPANAEGEQGAEGDGDADGLPNRVEQEVGGHPLGAHAASFTLSADAAASTVVTLASLDATRALARVHLTCGDQERSVAVAVPATGVALLNPRLAAGAAGGVACEVRAEATVPIALR